MYNNMAPKFHFAGVTSAWNRRALIAAGFGYGSATPEIHVEVTSAGHFREEKSTGDAVDDPESPRTPYKSKSAFSTDPTTNEEPLISTDTPFFHIDLTAAVRATEWTSLPKSSDDIKD
jgi:solute carrier family 26 (sodium-independent sulfate anion transporter), member 11